MKFINPAVAANYATRTGQADTEIIIPRLKWHSKLSRITPRVAEYMLANGTNIIIRKAPSVEASASTPAPTSVEAPASIPTGPESPTSPPIPAPKKPRRKSKIFTA